MHSACSTSSLNHCCSGCRKCRWFLHLPLLCQTIHIIPYNTISYHTMQVASSPTFPLLCHTIPYHTIPYYFIRYHASGFVTYLPLWCQCNSKSSICIAASFPEEPLANQTKAVAFKMIKRIMTLTKNAKKL